MHELRATLGDFFLNRRERGKEGLPLLSVTMHDGLVPRNSTDPRFSSRLASDEHLRVRAGDIAYNMMRMWQGASGLARHDGIVSPAYVVLEPQPNIDPLFASYWFKSERMIYLFWAYSYGLTDDRLRLYPDDFARIPATPPPLELQRLAGTTLAECDRAIGTVDALVAAKRSQFDWFRSDFLSGKKRLGPWKNPWKKVPLRTLLTEHGQRSTGNEAVFSVSVSRGLINQIEHLGRSFSASDTSKYNRVNPGDVVYTKSPTGKFPYGIVKMSRADEPAIVSPLYGVFCPVSSDVGIFLDALFSSPAFAERYLSPLVTKGAKNTINVTNERFLDGLINLPTEQQELQALVKYADLATKEIDLLTAQAGALRREKRCLMQKLLVTEQYSPVARELEAAE